MFIFVKILDAPTRFCYTESSYKGGLIKMMDINYAIVQKYFTMWQSPELFRTLPNNCLSPSQLSASLSKYWKRNWESLCLSEAPNGYS